MSWYELLTSPRVRRVRGEVGLRSNPGEGAGRKRGAREIKTGRARSLRRAATDAEQALWSRLRSRSLGGHKFVRQEPIGPYTVDFVCRERRLVIEVDGGQHADNASDVVRDKWLVERNYCVLRFWNNDVRLNMAGVLETIATALAEAPPHPDR
jgi:very-short-patch-repair endonuclease